MIDQRPPERRPVRARRGRGAAVRRRLLRRRAGLDDRAPLGRPGPRAGRAAAGGPRPDRHLHLGPRRGRRVVADRRLPARAARARPVPVRLAGGAGRAARRRHQHARRPDPGGLPRRLHRGLLGPARGLPRSRGARRHVGHAGDGPAGGGHRDGAAGGRSAQRRRGTAATASSASATRWSSATGWYWPSCPKRVILAPDAARLADCGGTGAGRPVPRHRPGRRDPVLAGQRLLRRAVGRHGRLRVPQRTDPQPGQGRAVPDEGRHARQVPAVRHQGRLPDPARAPDRLHPQPVGVDGRQVGPLPGRPLLVRAHRRVRALPRGHRRRQGPGVQGRHPAGRGRPARWTPTAT